MSQGKQIFFFLCVDCDDLIFYCHYRVRKKEKITMKLRLKFNVLCINANFFQLKPNHVYPKGESASSDLEFPTKSQTLHYNGFLNANLRQNLKCKMKKEQLKFTYKRNVSKILCNPHSSGIV